MLFMAITGIVFMNILKISFPQNGPCHFFADKADGIKNKSITVNNASCDELYWLSLSNPPVRGKFSTGNSASPLCRIQFSRVKLKCVTAEDIRHGFSSKTQQRRLQVMNVSQKSS